MNFTWLESLIFWQLHPLRKETCLTTASLMLQGEDQKKLDVVSNDVFCNALRSSGRTGTIASEEEDLPVAVEETNSGTNMLLIILAFC